MLQDISISKEDKRCKRCGEQFVHNEQHFSILRLENKELHRDDFCLRCWEDLSAGATSGDAQYISRWLRKFYDAKWLKETAAAEKHRNLRELAQSLKDASTRDERAVLYLCVLLLERQKLLKPVRNASARQGSDALCYCDPTTQESFIITEHDFSVEELEAARLRLSALFGK